MTNNCESDIKYVQYKGVVKKRALEYYYAKTPQSTLNI